MKTNLSTTGIAFALITAIAICAWVITMRSSYGGTEPIPPAKYDVPYTGRLIHQIVDSDKELAMMCGAARAGYWKFGCAYAAPKHGLCVIYTLPDERLEARGVNMEQVLRHELGHCNGWKHEEIER